MALVELIRLLASGLFLAAPPKPDPRAVAIVDSAIARMGGEGALRGVKRASYEVITEWQGIVFDERPAPPVLSYEWSTEWRDYSAPAWRYNRKFFQPNGVVTVVDLVVDSVAAMQLQGAWRPQNQAYVDERDEVFALTPDRILVLARDAGDLRALPDTTVRGTRFRRVSASFGPFRSATLFFRAGDGMLALARSRKAQPSDFGLAPWGEMELDVWYSRWRSFPGAGAAGPLNLPVQLDIWRAGRPYKRMTTVGMKVNPEIPADSLTMPDSLRAGFLARSRKPMFDLPLDSAKIIDRAFASFATNGTPAGAVKLGGAWLLVEAGTAPLSIERSAAYLERADAEARLAGAVVTAPTGSGGLAWLVDRKIPTWVGSGARPYVDAVLRGWNRSGATLGKLGDGTWLRVGRDSLRVETIDFPDYPATTVLYSPTLRWAYAWPAASPVGAERLTQIIKTRGWTVDRIGGAREIAGPASR
jgi:hypothetical protein